MTRKFSVVLLLFMCSGCFNQTSKDSNDLNDQIVFPYSKDTFDWKSIETLIGEAEKKKWIDSIPLLSYMHYDSLYLFLHSFDFNGDGLKDFVYNGPGPIDDWITIIGINRSDRLACFNLNGQVVDINFKDDKVCEVFTVSMAATSPPVEREMIFNVNYLDNLPIFKISFVSERASWTPLPNENEAVSYKFVSIDDTLILRDAPIELDTPYNNFLEVNGNQFGRILKGTKGLVIGQHTDSLKKDWLCVLIYANHKIFNYPLYENEVFDSTSKINRIAWIRDKGLKRAD